MPLCPAIRPGFPPQPRLPALRVPVRHEPQPSGKSPPDSNCTMSDAKASTVGAVSGPDPVRPGRHRRPSRWMRGTTPRMARSSSPSCTATHSRHFRGTCRTPRALRRAGSPHQTMGSNTVPEVLRRRLVPLKGTNHLFLHAFICPALPISTFAARGALPGTVLPCPALSANVKGIFGWMQAEPLVLCLIGG